MTKSEKYTARNPLSTWGATDYAHAATAAREKEACKVESSAHWSRHTSTALFFVLTGEGKRGRAGRAEESFWRRSRFRKCFSTSLSHARTHAHTHTHSHARTYSAHSAVTRTHSATHIHSTHTPSPLAPLPSHPIPSAPPHRRF